MPKIEKKDIWFDSADGASRVAGYIYSCPQVEPWCLVQIAHGMCEYMDRYADFAAFLAQNGAVVCGNDHLGHGGTAADEADLGYFTEKGGRRFAVQDMHRMTTLAKAEYPQLPVVLLGHSMGSFFARRYAALWPEGLAGLILSGTGGPNPLAGFGILMARLAARLRGPRYRSAYIHNLAFGTYLKRVESPKTNYDWISRDEELVRRYNADPRCTFQFTVNGFHELFSALREVSSPAWAAAIPRQLPILMIQGDADPVGDYGRGTAKVRDWLLHAGARHLEYILYPGGRHEMLNEINRDEVYLDVLAFLRKWWYRPDKNEDAVSRP